LTTSRRKDVFKAVQRVCNNNGVNLRMAMKTAGLSDYELAKVFSGRGDLKARHLNAALARFVQVGGLAFKIYADLGQGGNGKVLLAANRGRQITLKQAIQDPGDETTEQTNSGIVEGADGTQYQVLDAALSESLKQKLLEPRASASTVMDAIPTPRQPLLDDALDSDLLDRPSVDELRALDLVTSALDVPKTGEAKVRQLTRNPALGRSW
jgi:hypothetical protein